MYSSGAQMRFMFIALLAASICRAQAGNAAGTDQHAAGVSAPRLIQKTEPRYSDEALKAKLVGTVVLKCVVEADGKPRNFQVLHSLGMGLDENAIDAASGWRFDPGTKGGQPVNTAATIQVNFRLLEKDPKRKWHLARVEFYSPPGAGRPKVEKAVAPHVSGGSSHATTTVAFDVDEHGVPVNLRVEKTSDDDWARNVSAALSKWKFTPAQKDFAPISIPCTMEFVRGD
jgi:TonB family protein